MQNTDFEIKLIKKYGNGPIPRKDIEKILDEAVENNILEREEIGEYAENGEYNVSELLQLMRKWRTDFLKDSFSINDMCSYAEDSIHSKSIYPGIERCKESENGDQEDPDPKDSFMTTDDAFLSSLRDKTRIITERRVTNNRKVIKGVLKAWKEYEQLPVKKERRYWYLLILLLFIPLYFLYAQKPF